MKQNFNFRELYLNKIVRVLFHNGTALIGKLITFSNQVLLLQLENQELPICIFQPNHNILMIGGFSPNIKQATSSEEDNSEIQEQKSDKPRTVIAKTQKKNYYHPASGFSAVPVAEEHLQQKIQQHKIKVNQELQQAKELLASTQAQPFPIEYDVPISTRPAIFDNIGKQNSRRDGKQRGSALQDVWSKSRNSKS